MFTSVSTEIIARGKEAEDKAWRKKQAKRLEELGMPAFKVYAVWFREAGRVFIEGPEFESWEEGAEWERKFAEDKELQELERERAEKGMVVEGTNEGYLLADY